MRLILLVFTIFSLSAFAVDSLPFGKDYKARIENAFYEDGRLSDSRINAYKEIISTRADELFNIIYNYRRNVKGDSKKKARKKANKDDTVSGLRGLLPLVDKLKTIEAKAEQFQLAEFILDQDVAMLAEITPVNSVKRKFQGFNQFLSLYKMKKHDLSEYGEASNLVHPETGKVLSQEELKEMKAKGFDISLLNPLPNNGVIDEVEDISSVDVLDTFKRGKEALHAGLKVTWPAKNEGKFVKIRKTQSRPKVMFEGIDEEGNLREWKLKMSMEIHSEPTAAALGTALGMYTDLSKHVDDFKIYLGKLTWDEFYVDFTSYFEPEDLKKLVKSRGTDEKGEYIIFEEGMLEARFDDKSITRVGPYYPAHKKGKREVRGWQIFNIWINNTNLKKGENNKLIRRDFEGGSRLFALQHDIGFSFGNWRREKPTDFKWKAIYKNKKDEIVFNFRSSVLHDGWDHVTLADARWFTRKIAQLTREQITAAVKIGKWPNKAPYNYEQLLIEKLISRRNDMIVNFDLLGETLPNGKKIELMKFNKNIEKEAIPTHKFLPGETVDFRKEIRMMFVSQPLEALNDMIMMGAKAVIAGIQKISVNPIWFGVDSGGFVAEVLTHVNRTFTVNPDAKGENDQYIVRDDFAIGIRLGKGLGLGIETVGDLAYVKEYALIYPAASKEEVRKRKKFIVDFKMPYTILKKGLPKEHIFISQNVIEGRGRIKGETGASIVGPGAEASVSRILLNRTVLGHSKDGSITLYEDKAKSNEKKMRLYMKLGLIKIDQFSSSTEIGKIERFITKLDGNTENEEMERAINDAVFNHNFDKLKKFKVDQKITSDFIVKESAVSLFGFRSWSKELRVDDLKVFNYDEEGKLISQDLQMSAKLRKEKRWSFSSNGETKFKDIKLDSSYDVETGELVNPYVELQVGVDDLLTQTKEIKDNYLPFFNGAAGSDKFFDFTPEMQSYNDTWGQIEFLLTLQIHRDGIEKLLEFKEKDLMKEISKIAKVSEREVNKAWKSSSVSTNSNREKGVVVRYFGEKYTLSSIVRGAKKVLRHIKKAKKEKTRKKKMEKLTKALSYIVPNKSGYYSPILIRVINKAIGKKNFFMTAQMNIPTIRELENKLPARMKPYFVQGTKRNYVEKDRLLLSISDAIDLYKMHFQH
ncbi:MAG: hypothetical protein CME70_23650 [Halobacteriovorax sp.]|nr:hypothetical protein [Halobacteriovorax sp.]|tara:strand:+ start:176749 stop:180195 length:3447 start_codon:yes stop_codon:yes gene_type:complete